MTTLALGPQWLDPDYLISTFGLIGILVIVFAESGLLIGFFLPGDSLLFTVKRESVMWWDLLIGIGTGVLAAWLVLVIALLLVRPKGGLLKEAVRLLPDLLRLLTRLADDKTLPRGVRISLALLMIYLASPIDLIPDFLPVIGVGSVRSPV
nr:DedA protein [Streptomyces sp. F8]